MTMTKQDFALVASTIREARLANAKRRRSGRVFYMDEQARAYEDVAYRLAEAFTVENPRFNFVKFYEACGFDRWCEVCGSLTPGTHFDTDCMK